MTRLTMEEAQAKLKAVIEGLRPGESVNIVDGDNSVATLVRAAPAERKPRVPGTCKGMITVVSDDDEHLADFAEYMP